MTERIETLGGLRVLMCATEGVTLADGGFEDLLSSALGHRVDMLVLPVERLGEGFLDLRTGIAGAVLQKLVNYRLRAAVVGDVSQASERSTAWRDFVREANRGKTCWFVGDVGELEARWVSR